MTTDRTTISLPEGLKERAKKAGLNISGIAAEAILKNVEIMEHGKAIGGESNG